MGTQVGSPSTRAGPRLNSRFFLSHTQYRSYSLAPLAVTLVPVVYWLSPTNNFLLILHILPLWETCPSLPGGCNYLVSSSVK